MDLTIAISNAQSFSELLPIVRQAEEGVKLSCLGTRYIVSNNYDGSASIDALAEKVMELIEKNIEFSEQERVYGKELATRIDHIYDLSDELVQQCNCITRFFIWLRNFPYSLFANDWDRRCTLIRYDWSDCEVWQIIGHHKTFDFYTYNQFVEKFGYPPEEVKEGYHCRGHTNISPRLWSAPEKILNPLRG